MKPTHQLVLFFVAFLLALDANAAGSSFECRANVRGVGHTVTLVDQDQFKEMSVVIDTGASFSGRAVMYRHGTRYYLPMAGQAGVKLALNADTASLCFGDSGTDCHRCDSVPPRDQYVSKAFCDAMTSEGKLRVTLYSRGADAPEMVITDVKGAEVASGLVVRGIYSEETDFLYYGPHERYTLQANAGFFCKEADTRNFDPSSCYPCALTFVDGTASPRPQKVLVACNRDYDEFTLSIQDGKRQLMIFHNEPGTWIRTAGPAIEIAPNQWQLPGESLSLKLDGSNAQICTGGNCATCTPLPAP